MKILAIRGSNLASLDGEFEIDFTADNFAQDGLIAITGSTGAGKSTILDALCLALFNRIPRLPSRGSQTLIGRADEDDKQRLASHDVRHILRRGTGEGYAEVDFLGVDKKKYRATWTIRRARKRADGRFQSSEHQCIALHNDKLLGRTRKEVEEIIIEKLGLSFDQFRRSVLLAQGDFASFLKADAATRSRLLEMITGTEIYGEISRLAHQRASLENNKLEQLQIRLNEYDTLDNETRSLLKADLSTQEQQLKQQQSELKQWQEQASQLQKLHTLQEQLIQAKSEQYTQQHAWENAEPARSNLQQLKELQILRLPLQRKDDAKLAHQKTQLQLDPVEKNIQHTEELLNNLGADLLKQQTNYEQSEATMQQAKPELRRAYELDSQLQQSKKEQQALNTQQVDSQQQFTNFQQTTTSLQAAQQSSQNDLTAINTWLEQHKSDEIVATQWSYWASLFDDLLAKQQANKQNQQQHYQLNQEQQSNVEQLAKSQKTITVSQQQLSDFEQALTEHDEKKIQTQLEQCIVEIQSYNSGLIQLKEQEKLQQQFTKNHNEKALAQQEQKQLHTAITQAKKSKVEAEQEIIKSDVRLDEATQKNIRALLATGQSAEELRAKLGEGEACSVCGSHEHPFHTQGNEQLHTFADRQNERVQELQSQSNQLKKQLLQATGEIRFSGEQQIKLSRVLDNCEQQNTQIVQQWQRVSDQNIQEFQAEEDISAIQNQITAKQAEHQKLNQQRVQAEAIRKQKESCLATLAEQQSKQQLLEKTQQKFQSNTHHLEQQINESEVASEQIKQKLNDAIDRLELDQHDVSQIKQACKQRAENYQQQQEQQTILEKQVSQQQSNLEKRHIELEHANNALQQQTKALQATQQQLDGLTSSRKALLADYVGETTEQIEHALSSQLKQTKKRYEALRQDHQQQKERLISEQSNLENLRKRTVEQASLLKEQTDKLESALQPFATSEASVRESLAKDENWIQQQEQEFEQLKQALHTSKIHLQTAEQEFIKATQIDDLDTEHRNLSQINQQDIYSSEQLSSNQKTIQQYISEAEQACSHIQTSVNEQQFQLREDDNKRKQAKKLQRDYDKQDKTSHVWKVMKELIGSQTGAKFRNFAQSLTLEILLSHANQRMQELNRRYALQRVPQTDLELQIIDKEMGDEIRPVHSLSGGESFLVSLALALGLASLSSRKTQIDSLFIDEGFGTLDPQTLDTALSALDSLQSQGKTVCIISHVTAITERVAAQIRVKACGNGKSYIELV